MSDYEDPPEPTQEEMDEHDAREAVLRAPTVRIEGLTPEAVAAIIRSSVEATVAGNWNLSDQIDRAIDKAIEGRVSELTDGMIRERLSALIDSVIESGIPRFDSYNGREMSRTSLTELVQKQLTERSPDSYREKGITIAQEAVKRAVDKLFDKELNGLIDETKADFKRQADEVFKAKLVAGMREALGLR